MGINDHFSPNCHGTGASALALSECIVSNPDFAQLKCDQKLFDLNACQIADALTEILRNSAFWTYYALMGQVAVPNLRRVLLQALSIKRISESHFWQPTCDIFRRATDDGR